MGEWEVGGQGGRNCLPSFMGGGKKSCRMNANIYYYGHQKCVGGGVSKKIDFFLMIENLIIRKIVCRRL